MVLRGLCYFDIWITLDVSSECYRLFSHEENVAQINRRQCERHRLQEAILWYLNDKGMDSLQCCPRVTCWILVTQVTIICLWLLSVSSLLFGQIEKDGFWAAAPKGTKSCRTQGESVRPYVPPHPQGFVSFGAKIQTVWPKSKQNGPNPAKMGQIQAKMAQDQVKWTKSG